MFDNRSTMLTRYSFFFATLCIFQTSRASFDSPSLEKVLESTTKFFKELRLNYESQPATAELFEKIDEEVAEYVKKVKKSVNELRGERKLNPDEDIGTFDGLENVPSLVVQDAFDVTFFALRNEIGEFWYAVTLNSSGITLFQLQDAALVPVSSYDFPNGSRIISHSSEEATLLVVQRTLGDALVLRLSQSSSSHVLSNVQTLDTPDAIDSTLWRVKNHTYLVVASTGKLAIYEWYGEYFDRIQTLNLNVDKIIAFKIENSTHLAAVDESRTHVLKFIPQSKQLVVVQKFAGANDCTTLNVGEAHFGEHFFVLAGNISTIIYKRTRERFVPFQKLPVARKIRSLTKKVAVLLMIFENEEIGFYEYDGWRFVESGGRISGIVDGLPVSLKGEDFLLLKIRERGVENNSENYGERNGSETIVETDRGENGRASGAREANFERIVWSFRRIEWRRKKSWTSLREGTNIWCRESLRKSLRAPPVVPKVKDTIRIQRGHINKLRTTKLNGESAEKFANASDRWKKIISETKKQEEAVKRYVSTVNPVLNNLRARNVRVNCTASCRTTNMEAAAVDGILKRLRRVDDPNRNLDFRRVRVSFAENLPCPVPDLKLRDVEVTGLVNGISFDAFVEDVMKVTGDQELNAPFTFANLQVRNAMIPLEIASYQTARNISAVTLEAEELNITTGGFLLPLNGDCSVVTGSLTVSKARIKGLIDLRGAKIRGPGAEMINPMIHITEPLELDGNFTLRNVKIVETVEARDITRSKGKSFYEILSNAVALDDRDIPVHYKFRHDRVSWKNITWHDMPHKWLTKNNAGETVITGLKRATKPKISFGKFAFENLPTPRLPTVFCSPRVISEAIWESNLVVDRAIGKSVTSKNVFEDSELRTFFLDAATSFDEINWNLKKFTGRVMVKNAHIEAVADMDWQGLMNTMGKWVRPGCLKGPLTVSNLKVNHLITTMGFVVPLPMEVGNVVSRGNIRVKKLNNVDYDEFLKNLVKLEDAVTLTNVTFLGNLVANDIFAEQTSFGLQENLSSGYLGSKEILGKLESRAMIVPNVLEFQSDDIPVNIIVNGNVEFVKEPKIVTVNGKNLEQLYNEVWLTDRPTVVSIESIEFENVSFEGELTLLRSFDTPNLGPWAGIESRILSKTKDQFINVSASFYSIEAPNIIGAAKSRLLSNISYLLDLTDNSLKKNTTLVITSNWNFDELTVTGDLEILGLINGLNLATDVVRYDVAKNLITGKKTIVGDIIARNIDGLHFDEFAKNALRRNNGNRTIVIKGKKNFQTLELQHLRVEGKIMGRRMEDIMLKSAPQSFKGKRFFRGTLTAPAILMNGTINDVNLKRLVDSQLKKRGTVQTIETPMMFANDFTIFGNTTIDGLHQRVDLKTFDISQPVLESVLRYATEIRNFVDGIDVTLANRAYYWNDLQPVEINSTPLIARPVEDKLVNLVDLGSCVIRKSSLYCDNWKIFDASSAAGNSINLIRAEIFVISGIPLVASIISGPRGGITIFRYIVNEMRFYRIADLVVLGIVDGFMTTFENSLWFSLRRRDDTMILRYVLQTSNFHKWTLPGGEAFVMSTTPTEELLIIRHDGVWRLGGLVGPRHVFRAALDGRIDTFAVGSDFYVQLINNNVTTLLKMRYIRN